MGQADGIACRTVEMFNAFGLSDRLLREAYWVNETVFWRPNAENRSSIARTGRVQDTEDGLSEFPHVIVNQARIQDYLLDAMQISSRRLEPDYNLEVVAVDRDEVGEYPVCVTLRYTDEARQGKEIIPREGGHLVRFYVDLGDVEPDNRAMVKQITVDQIIATAQRILHPYTLDVKEVAWFSVYEVGQRLTDRFDDSLAGDGSDREPRVFIAGDACHTHSAKAGQGMNVSMQDAFNLGWKLAAVLEKRSDPSLLRTYSQERQPVAQELIDFDKEWSAMMGGSSQRSSPSGGRRR
jgi:phenol 2-monooxygenase